MTKDLQSDLQQPGPWGGSSWATALHELVEPVEHVRPGLQDVRSVRGVNVFPPSVDKPVRLLRKDLHLMVHAALLLQSSLKNADLGKAKALILTHRGKY
jgi:hypothetical protein